MNIASAYPFRASIIKPEVRDSTRHADTRIIGEKIRTFLERNPGYTATQLSREAGLKQCYVSSILREQTVECDGDRARKLLRAMRKIEQAAEK